MLQNTLTDTPRHIGHFSRAPQSQAHSSFPCFQGRLLDGDPQLLEQSYSLRYQVYCVERRFLPVENYPNRLECDEFDRHSLHLGTIDRHGDLAGTARLVRASLAGLPLFRHCRTFEHEIEVYRPRHQVVEVSRLAVSRHYRRRRDGSDALVTSLYKTLYQASKRCGFTHWVVATEPSLQRLVAQYGFPFRQIGPEIDYFGPVAPYVMDLAEFDMVILSGRFAALSTFLEGLEPEYDPRARFEPV